MTALLNHQAHHSPGLALAVVENVLFQLLSGARASVMVFNHLQPPSTMETSENILSESVQLLSPLKQLSHLQCGKTPPSPLLASPPVPSFVFITNCYFGRWLLRAVLLKLLPLISCAVFSRGPKGLINLLFRVAFLSGSFFILAIKERSIQARHIHFVSGVYVATF